MLPFEFTIKGPPVSSQTRNRARLAEWKREVAAEAASCLPSGSTPVGAPVDVCITYYYEGDTPDVDNVIKPIQDALVGIVYVDDRQVTETKSRKKSIEGSYRIRGVSACLLSAFSAGDEFLHVRVSEASVTEVLD